MSALIRIATDQITTEALDTFLEDYRQGREAYFLLSQVESFHYMAIEDESDAARIMRALEDRRIIHATYTQAPGISHLWPCDDSQSASVEWPMVAQRAFSEWFAKRR